MRAARPRRSALRRNRLPETWVLGSEQLTVWSSTREQPRPGATREPRSAMRIRRASTVSSVTRLGSRPPRKTSAVSAGAHGSPGRRGLHTDGTSTSCAVDAAAGAAAKPSRRPTASALVARYLDRDVGAIGAPFAPRRVLLPQPASAPIVAVRGPGSSHRVVRRISRRGRRPHAPPARGEGARCRSARCEPRRGRATRRRRATRPP